ELCVGEGLGHRRAACDAPGSLSFRSHAPGQPRSNPCFPELSSPVAPCLPEFPLVAAQAAAYPLVEPREYRGRFGSPEVSDPAVGVGPKFFEHALKASAPIALGDTPDSLHEPLLALGCYGECDLSVAPSDAEPQKLTPERTVYCALLQVDL